MPSHSYNGKYSKPEEHPEKKERKITEQTKANPNIQKNNAKKPGSPSITCRSHTVAMKRLRNR